MTPGRRSRGARFMPLSTPKGCRCGPSFIPRASRTAIARRLSSIKSVTVFPGSNWSGRTMATTRGKSKPPLPKFRCCASKSSIAATTRKDLSSCRAAGSSSELSLGLAAIAASPRITKISPGPSPPSSHWPASRSPSDDSRDSCLLRQALRMRDDSRSVAELAWYTLGAFILVRACLLWVSLEPFFGGLALILFGEWIHSINQAKAYLSNTRPSASQKPEPRQASALTINKMILSNEQKKQLIKSFIVLKPTTKSIVLNRSSSTKNNLWRELGDVFNRAGFGSVDGSVQTGFQEWRRSSS